MFLVPLSSPGRDVVLAPMGAAEIYVNSQDRVACQARVAWANDPVNPKKPHMPAGMGVQFTDISLDDLHAIRRFLEHSELDASW